MIIEVVSYGRRQGKPSNNFDRIWNCTNVTNPSKSSRKGRTGMDKRLRKEVMMEKEAQSIVRDAVEFCRCQLGDIKETTPYHECEEKRKDPFLRIGFCCEMGKHRSVSIAITVVEELKAIRNELQNDTDLSIISSHRDIQDNSICVKGLDGKAGGKRKSKKSYRCSIDEI